MDGGGIRRGSSAAAEVISEVDCDLPSDEVFNPPSAGGVPAVGGDTNSLYELSVRRGAFHGNRRSDMQAKIMARDHMSAGRGSYLLVSYTSGAK